MVFLAAHVFIFKIIPTLVAEESKIHIHGAKKPRETRQKTRDGRDDFSMIQTDSQTLKNCCFGLSEGIMFPSNKMFKTNLITDSAI